MLLAFRVVCRDVWLVMHCTVEFDNKAMLVAVEVDDESSDDCLPPELSPLQLTVP